MRKSNISKKLGKAFEEGKGRWDLYGEEFAALDLPTERRGPVLTMLEQYKYIEVRATVDGTFLFVNATAVQALRQIEADEAKKGERKDIVELVKLTLKKHPITAWVFIAFTVIGVVLAFTNQVLLFLKNVGVMK